MQAWKPAKSADDSVREAVSRIVERFQPDLIILFGSRARADDSETSDIDLMVVFNDLPRAEKRPRSQEIYKLLWNIGWPVELVVANEADVTVHAETVGFIYRVALKEGTVLYERPS